MALPQKSTQDSLIKWNFQKTLEQHGIPLQRRGLKTLQVNIGKLCNQACQHCHVESGPHRTEQMEKNTIEACLRLVDKFSIKTVDITGGAPELNQHFRFFVSELRKRNVHVMDRCNLTVFFEPHQEDTPEFLRDNQVEVVASLPCYSEENVRKQRGSGVFQKSIRALQKLNELGYGLPDTALKLSLVYNPVGPFLPPSQKELEAQYKEKLKQDFNIEFNQLFTITNMPIKRFADFLIRNNKYERYMELLSNAFNPESAKNVMCYDLVSVGWDGKLYDCDFNQMLELPAAGRSTTVFDVDMEALATGPIESGPHCFGCTAGSGSSCTGALK